jgi:phosphoserine phosphatase
LKLISEENIEDIAGKNVALMDLEGTLTHVKRSIPQGAEPEHMERILEGESLEGSEEIGYWTGIHLLAGEPPEEYLDRWRSWRKGDISTDEFEAENTSLWNDLVESSEFDSAEELLEWYNEKFLNLREEAPKFTEILQKKGYRTGIISHSSTSLSIHAAEKLGIDFVVPTWSFNFEDGRFVRSEMEKYAEEKSHIIDEIESTDVDTAVFFGNGSNDVNIAESADKGFLIENKDRVDYESVNAFTGTFEEIMNETKEVVE